MKTNLLDFSLDQLTAHFASIGEKPFRAKQVMRWMHQMGESDFEAMTDLAKSLRAKLQASAEVGVPHLITGQASTDGTRKWLLDVGTGNGVETVFIPEDDRGTLCISSQVGCALECTFCSTGRQGFNRNLSTAEIIGQLWWANKAMGVTPKNERVISNVVMMGMGEPLLNLANVVPAMKLMMDDFGFSISKRRVTLSTSGVVPALDMLGDQIDVALAISLHAPNDALRSEIMPINDKYNIESFLAGVRRYLAKSNANGGRVTVEYVLLDHINDDMQHAHELAKVLKETPCKINLIPFNPFPGNPFGKPSNSRIDRFSKVLMEYGLTVIVRKTRGDDIDAACGQLVGEVIDRTKRTMKNRMQQDGISVKMV